MSATQERPARVLPGVAMLVVAIVVMVVGIGMIVGSIVSAAREGEPSVATIVWIVGGLLVSGLGAFLTLGLFVVQPNQAVVLILFGRYVGTARRDGWFWANPFTVGARRKISLRVRNFDTQAAKVNDRRGNPVEIAAVVVWKVVDTARAVFDVDDFEGFVAVQSETAVRHLATQYPYDSYEEHQVTSLSGDVDVVSQTLQVELQERLAVAGVEMVETRLSHLSYAPEIAGAMLRRQQATAIVAARQKMVEGAVGMVDMALQKLAEEQVVEVDEERKAAMVSSLLIVLTGEQAAAPVLNVGSLYQ
ncbi:MAG TPA: SPFH domain-containing protein [Actinomycetota bacterium]|nr:SPFH domain-containing protein [Actinomycetota bacterium]